jgi:hypothetical protein
MRPLRLIGVACLMWGLEPASVCARQSQTAAYPTFVAAYRDGRLGAVDILLAMPEREVAIAVDRAINPLAGTPPWAWQDLRAAAMLHTDAWYTDLSNKRAGSANVQLEHAKELLARAVRLEPTLADYAQRWFDLVVLLLRKHETTMQLEDFHNRGRLLFPLAPAREKAIPFVRRGITAEYAGSTRGLVISGLTREAMDGVSLQMRWWADAATLFSQARSRWIALTIWRRFTSGASGCSRETERRRRSSSAMPRARTMLAFPISRRCSSAPLPSATAVTTRRNDSTDPPGTGTLQARRRRLR